MSAARQMENPEIGVISVGETPGCACFGINRITSFVLSHICLSSPITLLSYLCQQIVCFLCFSDLQSRVLKQKMYNQPYCTGIQNRITKSIAFLKTPLSYAIFTGSVTFSSAFPRVRKSNTRTRRRESPSSLRSASLWSALVCFYVTNRDGSRSYGTTLFYFEPLSSCSRTP